jgi:hypothetical protein
MMAASCQLGAWAPLRKYRYHLGKCGMAKQITMASLKRMRTTLQCASIPTTSTCARYMVRAMSTNSKLCIVLTFLIHPLSTIDRVPSKTTYTHAIPATPCDSNHLLRHLRILIYFGVNLLPNGSVNSRTWRPDQGPKVRCPVDTVDSSAWIAQTNSRCIYF